MSSETHHPHPVMILGCGRSGTSIFGELFDGLGSYIYESEPPFKQVLRYPSSKAIAVKVPTESPDYPADTGLSFPLDQLLLVHPSTTFFWIVRHPLDAICSLRIGIENDWGHHPRPDDWKAWQNRTLIERCAHRWATRVQDTNNEQFIEAQTSRNYSRPDHSRRIGRWRENLSQEEIEQALKIVSSVNTQFGYDLSG